ncbi:unnamed protein product [Sphagnum balticum]
MELASVMSHRLHLFDPSFSRKCTHIRFTAKFLSMRCSAAETRARSMDDEWEGSARLSLVQETLQNIPQRMPEKPPTDIQSDEPSKDSDESVVPSVQSETPKVTGKTRGEIFLERSKQMLQVHSERSSARAIKTTERRIRKAEKGAVAKRTEPCCYGCGTVLQTSAVEAPGYVPIDTFEVKKKHHQLKTILCGRCVLLSQGHMIPAVSGNGGYGNGKGFVSAEELRSQLSHLRFEKALIVKLVDIVDFNGSFLTRVRDLIGANPIILVATKVDLLPKGTSLEAVGDWLTQATLARKLNVISIHLTSAKAATGISGVASVIQRQRQGRDVYVMGSANVGKSAFITALLQEMGQRDVVAVAAQRYRPVQSAMPGTTLGPIQIDAFSGGGSLYDTPGVHLHHRMAAVVSPDDLPLLAPRRRLSGKRLPDQKQTMSLVGHSIFWGGVARIDVLQAPTNIAFTLYGPSSIPALALYTSQADTYYQNEVGKSLYPPAGTDRASWPGLLNQRDVTLTIKSNLRSVMQPAGDIAISGLGWVTVGATSVYSEGDLGEELEEHESSIVRLKVWVPKAVEVFIRPSIPVGTSASQWYEYMDVDDDDSQTATPRLVY